MLPKEGGVGEGKLPGSVFAGYVLLASQKPYPIIVSILLPVVDPILVTFEPDRNVMEAVC